MKKLFLIALCTLLVTACRSSYQFSGTTFPTPIPAPDIELTSAQGPISLAGFTGKFTFVYFGYTFCPDVCPITLATLKQVRAGLGDHANELQVVMITVDPDRDTPEQLADYVHRFDPSFVGLSAEPALIDRVGEPFGLYYQKQEGSKATGYLVDHTARLYLLDRQSNGILSYAYGTSAEVMLQDLTHLIEER